MEFLGWNTDVAWWNVTEDMNVYPIIVYTDTAEAPVSSIGSESAGVYEKLELRSIFKDVVVQRCIVHLIRNSIKYIPSKDYKAYTAQLKRVYGAPSLKAAEAEFERFKQAWSQYPGAIDVWVRNWAHVEQLFNYGSAVRKIMYTTNSIEALNSSFRKVTKKGSFPSEDAALQALYLRLTELYKKWANRPVPNWAMVRNQLSMDAGMQARIMKYEKY